MPCSDIRILVIFTSLYPLMRFFSPQKSLLSLAADLISVFYGEIEWHFGFCGVDLRVETRGNKTN